MSNEYEIMAVGVNNAQLWLLSKKLYRWKMQHNDVNWNDIQLMNINQFLD